MNNKTPWVIVGLTTAAVFATKVVCDVLISRSDKELDEALEKERRLYEATMLNKKSQEV